MPRDHIHFITGRLAEHALKSLVAPLADQVGFDYTVDVLPITVAALMTPEWIARRWRVPPATTRVILPGYCDGDVAPLAAATTARIERGPRDLRGLPAFFLREPPPADYGGW